MHTVAADLATRDGAAVARLAALDWAGRIDILINNAGGGVIRPTLEHTEDTLRATIDRNLWTTIYCTLEALPVMRKQGYGRIVNVGAESVRNGLYDHAIYNAAKGGVHGLTTGLAREFVGDGITVQDGNTADMIFGVAETIEFLSQIMTLEPGDIIATGTPAGVGMSRTPQLFLHPGDIVEVEIDGIGTLRNPVAEAA